MVNGERARDCEGYILRDNKHHFQGEVDRDEGGADGQVNAVVREMPRQKGEGGYPAGFYHRALHRSPNDLLILFGGRGGGRKQTSGNTNGRRRKSCGTCRCGRRPCHRTWKTSITRQSLKRRSLARGREDEGERGSRREPTRGRDEDVPRDST